MLGLINGFISRLKTYKPNLQRLAQLEESKKDLMYVLMEQTSQETVTAVVEDLGIKSGADVSMENIYAIEEHISKLKPNKERAILLDKIKKALIAELDELHNTYFGLQKRIFHKAYLKETNKSVIESAKVGGWEKTLKMSVAFTAKGHSPLAMNFLQSLTDIDIETDIGKKMPQALTDFFLQLNGNERIQIYKTANIQEAKDIVYPLLGKYIRTYIEPAFTDTLIKELSVVVAEKIKAISIHYPLSKKSKHLFHSRTHIKEGIENYFKESLPAALEEIMTVCVNRAENSKEIFFGIILYVVDLLYHPLYNHDENIARVAAYMVDSAHEAMITEHNNRSYALAVEEQKDLAKEGAPHIKTKEEPNNLQQNGGKTLSEKEHEMIITIVSILDIKDMILEHSLIRYLRRMVSKNKKADLGKRLKAKGIIIEDDNVWNNVYEIIEKSNLSDLFEKPTNNNSTLPSQIEAKEEENGEHYENGFDTIAKHINPTAADLIDLIEKNNMTLTDKTMFERKFDQLTPSQQVACKRVLITSIDHPTLWKKKTYSNKYRTLNFGGKFRIVAHHKEILGIFSHGKDYEKLYTLFNKG